MEWVANGSDTFRGNSLKNDKQKRQHPIMGNWRDKIGYNLSGSPALIVPVEPCKSPGKELGFFWRNIIYRIVSKYYVVHGGFLLLPPC